MLYEMAALHPAFDAYNLISLFFKIVKGKYEVCDYLCQNVVYLLFKYLDNINKL